MLNLEGVDFKLLGMLASLLVAGVEFTAILSAIHAMMVSRTSQGAIAWAICLVSPPLSFVALPAYWILGRSRFHGYINARRAGTTTMHDVLRKVGADAREQGLVRLDAKGTDAVFEWLAWMPFTRNNRVQLLIDGQATFDAIFDSINSAEQYVLVQFFIVKDDDLGRALKDRLIAKCRRGVRVYFIYDEIGCRKLPKAYVRELCDAGAEVTPFHSNRRNRFQINFRNHRKIVVADGRVAFLGGLNVGDEYMGRGKRFGSWRDTHVRLAGPSVQAVQLSFLEDWFWARQQVPELHWLPQAADDGDQDVLVLPTGPADRLETCGLFFLQMINMATDRLWLASPYFVPDVHVTAALQLAALRGVDVRIVLPEKPDHLLVYLSSFSFLGEMEAVGVKIYRYQKGFMHHKVLLVDNRWGSVGTANLDNRSFRLNFEITALVESERFNAEMAEMFQRDFQQSRLVDEGDLARRSIWFKIGVRIARLMAPLQ